MKYANNIKIVKQFVKGINNKEVVARIGLRTNGDIHLGNIISILTPFIIGKELIKQGYKFKLLLFLVDLELDNDAQKPFIYQEDKSKCHKNLAEHSTNIVLSLIKELKYIYKDINVTTYKVSEILKTKPFQKIISERFLSLKKSYPLCKKCKSINRKFILSNNNISFKCNFCNSNENLKLNQTEFAIEHDLLGAIENYLYPIDIHIIGRDHSVSENKELSSFEKREKYYKLLKNKKEYITFITPLVIGKNNKKMSKSNNNGLFLTQIKEDLGSSYCNKLLKFVEKIIFKKIEIVDMNYIQEKLY